MAEWKQQDEGDSDAYKILADLLEDLRNGNISFNDLQIKNENGLQLSYVEFMQILEYLRRNPSLLINLSFLEK